VVTNAFKGEDLNNYVPIFRRYGIPVLFNFQVLRHVVGALRAQDQMGCWTAIYPEGIRLPDYFFGKSIVHLPTVKCHIYTTTTGAMKNAFGGLLNHQPALYPHLDPRDAGGPAGKIQKEIHAGVFAVMDGTTAGNGTGPRVMKPESRTSSWRAATRWPSTPWRPR
jgi:uncharacterized protein (DUF362 family)